jgi:short-subunit dehydrogenase
MRRVIVLGATSGIAQALERSMAASGLELLLVGRSQERLDTLQADLLARGAASALTLQSDLADTTQHARVLQFAAEHFPDFDTVVTAYGSMLDQAACQVSPELALREVNTNFSSAVSLLTLFGEYFRARGSGTLAAITSVAGDRGRRPNYVYGAAKGGLSIFLQGLRSRLYPFGVRVLTIKPGPVNTAMTAHLKKSRLFAEPGEVAADIFRALKSGRGDVIYTPWHWRWIMLVLRLIPERSFKKLSV